ncbi:MAG TPA: biotin-dependent carboxyltransferase family protein [Marinagarivorans sp.]
MSRFGLLRVLQARGKLTTQDLGRKGWLHLGLCESGAADELAFLWANHLLGNACDAPALEITLGQVSLEFTLATTAVLTGAEVAGQLNDAPVTSGQSFRVAAGDVLRLSIPRQGVVNYLSVQGGFCITKVCGSASICEREKIGPFDGAPLNAGDCVGYRAPAEHTPLRRRAERWCMNHSGENIPLLVPIVESVAAAPALHNLLNQRFRVSTETNRMGCRLQGDALNVDALAYQHRASAGVPYGAIQLPPDGQPIVLLKDRQTMGGYPIIACLSRWGAGRLAQCRPGEAVTFCAISIAQARQQWRDWYGFFSNSASARCAKYH